MRKVEERDDYVHQTSISTRWIDNDIYGHVNNVIYYAYFDTVINEYLIREGGLDIVPGSVIGVCAESFCQYHRPIRFPDVVEAGLRVSKLGNSSVRYEVGIFTRAERAAAASGYFVHVFVDRESRRPVAIPHTIRKALARLLRE